MNFGAALCCILMLMTTAAQATERVKLALLKFGTVSWEAAVIKRHELDHAHGIDLSIREVAGGAASRIALQTGAADVIVADWVWVARQRAEGRPYAFAPWSRAVGALVVPAESEAKTVGDLKGKRLGVAGGSLDKSWLLLRALTEKKLGADAASVVEPVFGAPPLLNAQLERGRMSGVLTYWHYAARLKSKGARELISVEDMIRELGVKGDPPMLGFVFRDEWARENPQALRGLIAASRAAKDILVSSPKEWRALAPRIGAADQATLDALQEGFASGVPHDWGEREIEAARELYRILARLGGERLVGAANELPAGVFWRDVSL